MRVYHVDDELQYDWVYDRWCSCWAIYMGWY